ncbi:MAG: bifunctional adenosylcobinamide kinase/adenosylcobinamide-phosphate guanylyltransferase [Bacilli bacterium]
MKVLITGGARSGKSTYAESFYKHDDVKYIATYVCNSDDLEMVYRIKKHKLQRNLKWETIEVNTFLNVTGEYILMDCLSIFVSNIMFYYTKDAKYINGELIEKIYSHIKREITTLVQNCKNIIIVTNEVGLGLVPINHVERVYRDVLGRTNRYVADMMDDVYLVVCGQPLKIK